MEKYHTLKEVADTFRLSVRTLRRWIEEDKHFDRSSLIKIPDGQYLIPDYEVKRLSDKFNTLEDNI